MADHERMTLPALLAGAAAGDEHCTRAVHERVVSCNAQGRGQHLNDLIDDLAHGGTALSWAGQRDAVVEAARLLTLAKFSPWDTGRGESTADAAHRPRRRLNCRNYFAAAAAYVARRIADHAPATPLENESAACAAFAAFVRWQFHRSCLESRRSTRELAWRFRWQWNGEYLTVWMPRHMNGRQCQQWLLQHVPEALAHKPLDRAAVQKYVDDRLGRREIESLEVHTHNVAATSVSATTPGSDGAAVLAAAVAREKVLGIDQQRAAVRALGPVRLEALVRGTFAALETGHPTDAALARAFGLTKATYSRFAGRCWQARGPVPDLWRNTASVLALVPAFREAAADAGVWPRVQRVLQGRDGAREVDHA